MIRHSANGRRHHPMLACDAAEVWPKPFANLRPERGFALGGAPDKMKVTGDEGMHAFCRPYGTSRRQAQVFPALKRWATIGQSLRDAKQIGAIKTRSFF